MDGVMHAAGAALASPRHQPSHGILARMKTRQRLSHLKKIDRLLRWSRMLPFGPTFAARLHRLVGSYDAVRPDQHQKLRWTLEYEGMRHRAIADWLWRETQAVEAHARAADRAATFDPTETRPPQSS
jgi:hypothetical protein